MYVFQINTDNLPYEKVGKNEPVCIADEVPFEIPESWEWVRLKNCCIDIFSGCGGFILRTEKEHTLDNKCAPWYNNRISYLR